MVVRNRNWPWFAIRVGICTEKTANLHLENAGYESFFTISQMYSSTAEGHGELEVPLFPGYLFCRMNPHYRLPILQAPGGHSNIGRRGRVDSGRGRRNRGNPAGCKERARDYALAVLASWTGGPN